jgi:hypothetical protein
MAERLRSTGRKSNSIPLLLGLGGARAPRGTASAIRSQASAALAAATKKAARQPARSAIRPAQPNDSAPETPMLAAWPAAARDKSFASTSSARSLRPIM